MKTKTEIIMKTIHNRYSCYRCNLKFQEGDELYGTKDFSYTICEKCYNKRVEDEFLKPALKDFADSLTEEKDHED